MKWLKTLNMIINTKTIEFKCTCIDTSKRGGEWKKKTVKIKLIEETKYFHVWDHSTEYCCSHTDQASKV